MNKHTYFLNALRSGAGKKRHWVNSVFSLTHDVTPPTPYPYQLYTQDEQRVFDDPDTGEVIAIEDQGPLDAPLARFREAFHLSPGEVPNYTQPEPVTTTYGNVLVNYLLLILPFHDQFPFQTGHFSIKRVETEIHKRLIDDPEVAGLPSDTPPPDGKVYVRQYLMFGENALSLVGYADLGVVSLTPKALQSHPKAREQRDALLERYKGSLTDPAVIAKIGKEMEALDREWLKGDPAGEFYDAKGKKGFGKVRNKLFYMFGGESGFSEGTSMELIERSLEEGIDPDKLPAMINSLRAGSYNRGAQTQLGGESTKTIYRMLGTVRIADDDCETAFGVPVNITEDTQKGLIGFWIIDNKTSVLLTEENIHQYTNTTVYLRSPLTCRTEGRNVCRKCVGKDLEEQPDGLPAAAAALGGIFLGSFLSLMHGRALETEKWDKKRRLS